MSTPRRVLYVIDELSTPNAGTERQLLELLGGLDRQQYEPHLAIFRRTPYLQDSTSFCCPVHDLGIPRLATPRAIAGLAGLSRLVRRLDAGLAHVYFNDASIAAPAFCRLAGSRVVVSRRDMGFWYTPSILTALRFSNRYVDLIAANSEAVRRNVHLHERYPMARIMVIPNGHDQKRFEAPGEPGFRERLGISPSGKIVGMVANLYPRKRQADLIRALVHARETIDDVHVVLVGSGEDVATLRQLASDLGQTANVHIVSGVSDVVPIVKHFDVAVLCSDSEGLSNALIEYALCGRPIVCTDVGGNAEVVNQDTGVLVERGNVTALASAVRRLLESPGHATALGARARNAAAVRFTRRAMLASHHVLYDRMTSGRLLSMRPATSH